MNLSKTLNQSFTKRLMPRLK